MYPILAIQAAPGEIISGGLFFLAASSLWSYIAVKPSWIWLLNDC
jgi:hypothetical protein